MRIKRSVSRIFGVLVVPAITVAVVAYFGAYTIWGNRGVLALVDTQAQLGIEGMSDASGELATSSRAIAILHLRSQHI